MDDIDIDLFDAAAVVFRNADSGEITTTIAMGDFRARSANRVLHRRSFYFIADKLNEFEFDSEFSMYLYSFFSIRMRITIYKVAMRLCRRSYSVVSPVPPSPKSRKPFSA